jgi:transcriptional antiterminator RfaH
MLTDSGSTFACRTTKPHVQGAGWFCIQTHPKHEHLAAAHLNKVTEVEAFFPRIRFNRSTRRGLVLVTEALFPGYLFVRFDWDCSFRQVQSSPGVRDIVHFGDNWPVISENIIRELREIVGITEMHTIVPEFFPGDTVRFTDGNLRGLRGVVSRVMPGQKRVEVLMDLLGRQTGIELAITSLLREGNERAGLFAR